MIFDIIYELIEHIRKETEALLEPEVSRKDLGKMKILAIFKIDSKSQIVGGKVTTGSVKRGAFVDVLRNNAKILSGRMTQLQHNKEDVENIKKLARKLKVDGLMIRAGNASNNKKIKEKYYTWGNKKGFCRRFWYCAIINCDGSLVPCCNFLYKKDDFGNVFESGFKEVWNNEIYQQNRKAIIEANIKNLNKVCKNCYKYHEN